MTVEIKDSSKDWYELFERLVEALEIIADSFVDEEPDGPEGLRVVE